MHSLFIYGTLKDPIIQKKIIGRIIKLDSPDTLIGYSRSEVYLPEFKNNVIFIESDNKGKVEGFVIKINDEELKKIDEYETDFYQRVLVTLASGNKAFVYQK